MEVKQGKRYTKEVRRMADENYQGNVKSYIKHSKRR